MTTPSFSVRDRPLSTLHDQKIRGLIDLNPARQRGKVWDDARKIALIDSVLHKFPMGSILLEVLSAQDLEGNDYEQWEVVDGQQRLTTLFEYIENNEPWTDPRRNRTQYEFKRFTEETQPVQDRVRAYELPVTYLYNYESSQIDELFLRVQFGMALTPGEKIKVVPTRLREAIVSITNDEVFETTWGAKYTKRDGHFMLAASFLESSRKANPFQRFEFLPVQRFLIDDRPTDAQIRTAISEVKSTLKITREVITRVHIPGSSVAKTIGQSARLMKYLYACFCQLNQNFHISGRQIDLANGLTEYMANAQGEGQHGVEAPEYQAWRETLRSGRMDTDDVKLCVGLLANYLVNSADLRPKDERRFFSESARREILQRSNNRCQCQHCPHHVNGIESCGTTLADVNFHADHIVPWSAGGQTTLENAQALCSACNTRKRASVSYIQPGE